jgi:hypothetical protein
MTTRRFAISVISPATGEPLFLQQNGRLTSNPAEALRFKNQAHAMAIGMKRPAIEELEVVPLAVVPPKPQQPDVPDKGSDEWKAAMVKAVEAGEGTTSVARRFDTSDRQVRRYVERAREQS